MDLRDAADAAQSAARLFGSSIAAPPAASQHPPRARARAMGVPPLHAPPRRFLPRAWLGNFVEHLNRV
ncbi:hypothetical protein OsJ_18752 [Oryza sativa Japonica Group]|uniref:Uncharacterized protein n=1 Tax=Oryza sativa subsp. japonica TaxID=39947 RepID=B9FPW8_ORYSJ|nr:hypothetical protein OsJ_18752 [Oryza sativa Japonica Group]